MYVRVRTKQSMTSTGIFSSDDNLDRVKSATFLNIPGSFDKKKFPWKF